MKMPCYQLNKSFSLILVVLLMCKLARCQDDAAWWNETHHWDGITPWQEYIVYSPSYLGPNALTIPYTQKGIVKDRYEFHIGFNGHFSKGDNTQDIYLRLYYPVLKNTVAIELYGVPVEHYDLDEKTSIERRIRHRKGEGFASGDLYFSTIVQILRKDKYFDLAFRMACKTASGGKLSDARFTDAPAYFFDLSAGKDIIFQNKWLDEMCLHTMAGFYSWQMNLPNNQQNDAFLYGAGLDMIFKSFRWDNSIEGYLGYFGKRLIIAGDPTEMVRFNDRPMIFRTQLVRTAKLLDLILGYQKGINNFKFQTINLSFLFHLN